MGELKTLELKTNRAEQKKKKEKRNIYTVNRRSDTEKKLFEGKKKVFLKNMIDNKRIGAEFKKEKKKEGAKEKEKEKEEKKKDEKEKKIRELRQQNRKENKGIFHEKKKEEKINNWTHSESITFKTKNYAKKMS